MHFYISADAEAQIRQMLSVFPLYSIINILEKQIKDLPPNKRKFYLDEINMWGALGDKQQLISDVISVIEDHIDLDDFLDIFDELSNDFTGITAQKRYIPSGSPEGFEWSQKTSPQERLKWMKYYQYPGYYTKEEQKLIHPHPEKEYIDPDLLEKELEEGKVLGLGPIIPEAFPELEKLNVEERDKLKKNMEDQIYNTVQPEAAPAVPRPFLMEMVYDYLYLTDPEAAEQFRIDGVSSRSRFGFHTKAILRRMFNSMSLEDLYLYWNSIVNYKELPWVNTEHAIDRFGGGQLGRNIESLYNNWAEDIASELPNINWPEELEWEPQTFSTPEWENE